MRNVELSPSVTNHLEAVAGEAGVDEPPRSVGARLAPLLPDEVHDALIGFRQGCDQGGLFIRGVGPGEVSSAAENYTHLQVASPLLLGLVSLIATPVSARNEWDGAPLTDIKVTAGLEDTVSSKGKGTLPLHQEDQHLENPPDGLALLTITGGSPTRLAPTVRDHRRARGQRRRRRGGDPATARTSGTGCPTASKAPAGARRRRSSSALPRCPN